jgi:hypothetical protein
MGLFSAELGTELAVEQLIPAAGTLQNFYVFIQAAPAANRSWTFTVRNTGADTAVTCTITAGTQSCSDLTHTAAFAAGDLIAVHVTASTPAPAGTPGQWTAVYGP